MQAITTSFVPATDTKPARIRAKCQRGKAFFTYHNLDGDSESKHREAALKLREIFIQEDIKRGIERHRNSWANTLVTATTYKEDFVHVLIP